MDVLLGLQWGDEGKGKIVDVLAPKYDGVVRFQGGPNAGHTLEFDGKKVILHQIPSGAFHEDISNIIGNGLVLDLAILRKEIESLLPYGCDVTKRLYVSKKAHIILPTHRLLDAMQEQRKGDKKIGSTLKGIGPTYQDKTGRLGIRVGDLSLSNFADKYQEAKDRHLKLLEGSGLESELAQLEEAFFSAIEYLKANLNIVDTDYLLNEMVDDRKLLAEGAQGSLLDVDFGSYPYVTSSNTFVGGVCQGTGIPPTKVGEVIGIYKAYCTRVGGGPFPTELLDETGDQLRNAGHEFGSTTGRPRRCGWLDLPALKYAVMINGVTQLAMTKADVLSGFDEVKVCTHYKMEDGTVTDRIPFDMVNESIEPVYVTLKGWHEDITTARSFGDLPDSFKAFIKYVEEYTGVDNTFISVGPDRTEYILKD